MARNSEKAQSMLYRFREQQAVDMGIGNRVKGERRPRMASSCTSLREAERWRGDILRDISRKVSKIQDVSLTDYQIRDLNDEINALFREKRHWENQIVNLGGANYKRANTAMTDADGREVPGTRGYKYFGRAKDLPGVKELFTKGAQQATEESARNASFQMFRHQGPGYYGDEDELDAELAAEEDELAKQEWKAATREAAEALGIELEESDFPPYPTAGPSSSSSAAAAAAAPAGGDAGAAEPESAAPKTKGGKSKRKTRGAAGPNDTAPNGENAGDAAGAGNSDGDEDAKKAKTGENGDGVDGAVQAGAVAGAPDAAYLAAQAQAMSFLGVLDSESLKFPVLPSKDEMAQVLLDVRKKALREEYGV